MVLINPDSINSLRTLPGPMVKAEREWALGEVWGEKKGT
jgi:hypothetical protein